MSGATIFDLPTVPRLQTLLQNVADGTFLIPRFQREFLWRDDQRFRLLDSVLKGLPIGSLMVWRTTEHKLECYENLKPFRLNVPPADQRIGVQTYLLDGLQRLTTLFGALRAEDDVSTPVEGESRWPVYYDLHATADASDYGFKLAPKRKGWEVPETWLPLSVLFDPNALWDFQQRLLQAPTEKQLQLLPTHTQKRTSTESRELTRKAEVIATRFKDYTVPVIPIHTNDIDLATESFQRVNSEGTPMNERHMLVALTFGRPWDVDQGLRGVSQKLSSAGWAHLDDTILLNALKSYFDIEVQKRAVRELCTELQKHERAFEKLADSAVLAVRFLSDKCGVRGPMMLPYSYQLVSLIDLAMRDKNLEVHADNFVQWIRATTYAEYFASMNSTQIKRAITHARGLADSEGLGSVLPDDLNRKVAPLVRYNYNSARTRAFVWALIDQGPLDAVGSPLNAARAVGLRGNDALDLIFPGLEASLPANRVVIGDAEIGALRRVLRDRESPMHAEICRSHFIDEVAAQMLFNNNPVGFFERRAHAIWISEKERISSCGLTPDESLRAG